MRFQCTTELNEREVPCRHNSVQCFLLHEYMRMKVVFVGCNQVQWRPLRLSIVKGLLNIVRFVDQTRRQELIPNLANALHLRPGTSNMATQKLMQSSKLAEPTPLSVAENTCLWMLNASKWIVLKSGKEQVHGFEQIKSSHQRCIFFDTVQRHDAATLWSGWLSV